MRRTWRALSPIVLVAGCYSYAPARPADIRPGMGVRARVSAATAERIAPLLGGVDTRVFSGDLVDTNAGTLTIEVPTTVAGMGGASQTLHQRISLASGDVLELETRQLDKPRTALVVGGVVAVAITSAISALRPDPGTNAPGGGSSPPENRIPIWRWHF